MSKQRIDVFISSTSIDLPEHRAAVRDAILSLGLYPSGMEHWPVAGENPVDLCRQKVSEAEIYLGVYAHRYGWRPEGYDGKSITELEYEWAAEVQRDGKPIPRLCFIMSDDHPWPKKDMELDAQADLNAFKARVKQQQVGFFTTPDDLKAQVIAALAPYASRTDGRVLIPYLRWLHEQSKRSGLLHVLNPRDATSTAKPITVEQVYTPLDTRHTVTRDKEGNIRSDDEISELKRAGKDDDDFQQSSLTAMEAANLNQRLVLLGDPGSGKSTFVNFLALCLSGHVLDPDAGWLAQLSRQGWEHGEKLPVVVTLRDFAQDVPAGETSGTAAHLFDHIERMLTRWKLADAFPAIRDALDEGRALVMLDGLDEVPLDRRELVRGSVTDFMTRCHRDNRYLITCRILSYTNPDWKIPAVPDETLAPFDKDKITHFIRAWYTALESLKGIDAETAKERVADLTEGLRHPHLGDIATNPMLLTVMAIVHNHTGALPRESARLYEECVKLLMERWKPIEARTLLETLDVRQDDLYRMLWEIAYDAHDKQSEWEGVADISEADVMGIAAAHLNRDMSKAQAFCDYVESRAGLLIGRGSAGRWRVFTFPHRTFQEYLAGCYAANNDFSELVPELARRGAGWREVLMLATGHLVFNQGRINDPLLAIDELVPPDEAPQTDEDWRLVWLAGDMLALLGVQPALTSKRGARIVPRVQERLADLVSGGHLPLVERAAAGRALAMIGDPRFGVGVKDGLPEIDWVEIPAGTFLMGSDKAKDRYARDDEIPQHEVDLPAYHISRYPITYAQFQAFLDAPDGFYNPEWWDGLAANDYHKAQPGEPDFPYANHPREHVSWYDAAAFCRWLTAKLGYEVRLPTEAEWEKAARGMDGRIYPYGDEADPAKGNTYKTGIGGSSAVGLFPDGASPYGALDMSGNVWEWCLTKWRGSYDEPEDNSLDGTDVRVLRGGSWGSNVLNARAASRNWDAPFSRFKLGYGFRVVCASPIPSEL
jgi:formylglycine-generating enzyme required for sulfatase activity